MRVRACVCVRVHVYVRVEGGAPQPLASEDITGVTENRSPTSCLPGWLKALTGSPSNFQAQSCNVGPECGHPDPVLMRVGSPVLRPLSVSQPWGTAPPSDIRVPGSLTAQSQTLGFLS